MSIAVYGWEGQLAFTTDPISPGPQTYKRLNFHSSTLGLDEEFVDTTGLPGTRSHSINQLRKGNRHVGGQIHFQPTPLELSWLLPLALGGTPTGGPTVSYPLNDILTPSPGIYFKVDNGSKVMTYDGCQVDKLTIAGRAGQPLDVMFDLVGIDETQTNAGTFPDLALDVTGSPFMFTDLQLGIDNAPNVLADDFNYMLDNSIDKNRFFNQQTLTGVFPMDRHVTSTFGVPYGDEAALYNISPGANPAGVAVSAAFTGAGTSVFVLNFLKMVFPRKSATYRNGRGEVMLSMQGVAKKTTGGDLEVITTLHL